MSAPALSAPGAFVDSDHSRVVAFAREVAGEGDARARAVKLYYAVRDRIRYDPYRDYLDPDTYRASATLVAGRGFCVAKAALLAAGARAIGIPARVGYADVRNHLASRKLLQLIGTDRFIYHGYTDLLLDGRWVRSTPAFDIGLCDKFEVKPLDFDGREDSVLHPFDQRGRRHMEYLTDHGVYADVPFERILDAFKALYPAEFLSGVASAGGDLGREAEAER